MSALDRLPAPIRPNLPLTALAPMQDVTDVFFMQTIAGYGCPDYFFTEYFRVHTSSTLEQKILRSITENDTGRPIFAQMIGESIPDLVRTAQALSRYAIAGIDLNLGCPAPRVYRKNVGGGLLRDLDQVKRILSELRSTLTGRLSVKMRLGFDTTEHFDRLLDVINQCDIDLLSLHGRTVKQGYQGTVHYDLIAQAVQQVNCPVLANGNVTSAASAIAVLSQTQAAGVMIGRAAIRNPWIFQQVRQTLSGQPVTVVTLAQVRDYIEQLRRITTALTVPEASRVGYLKGYLNYIAPGVDADGRFLREMRRTRSETELLQVCDRYLLSHPETAFAIEEPAVELTPPQRESQLV